MEVNELLQYGNSIPASVWVTLSNILSFAAYVLPMNTIVAIIKFRLGLIATRIAIALALRIKSFIPVIGS